MTQKYSIIFRPFLQKNLLRIVYSLTLILVSLATGQAQNHPVGHLTVTYTDPDRANRPVPSELYYPAVTGGENTPPAPGAFPVIVFGHGFQMGYDSYSYFRDAMVPDGYVLVFPKTETSLSPDHAEYGADLAFLVAKMKSEGTNPSSVFFQHIDSTSAVMGHSMGGGASLLGCKNNTLPTAMVTWAAAETNPSAIAAAPDIVLPSLLFSAEKDCVTPPATNQVPMYNGLASDCKVYISVLGGGHCYFADANFICSLGEIGCPPFTITRDQQHSVTLDFTTLFLAHYLKNQPGAWNTFNDSLNSSPRIAFEKSCTTTSAEPGISPDPLRVFPNPAGDRITLSGTSLGAGPVRLRIQDVYGTALFSGRMLPVKGRYGFDIDITGWVRGVYIAEITGTGKAGIVKVLKN